MNMPPPPSHRRKTPSFSSSLLDSILRSIDDDHQQQQQQVNDDDLMFFPACEPKWSSSKNEEMPSLRRAIMIDQWMETHNNRNRNGYASRREFVSDSSSSATTTFSSETDTPSTYRSLPNSLRKTVFGDDNKKVSSKFMKSTKLRAMKIYGKVKQPMSPGSRISAFIYSLFASSSKKDKLIEESAMQNLRSLRSINKVEQDTVPTTTCTSSFSRSCMSKKQHSTHVKRSVRFYPENDIDPKSNHQRQSDSRRWFTEKKFIEDDEDEDEDDLFELEITGAYTQELPVFETTDLRKIRI